MDTMNERFAKLTEKINALEKERKIEERKIKEAEKKRKQHRFYVVGEIVVKEFPGLEKIIPGTKAENKKVFAGFERFLKELSSDEKITLLYQKCMEQVSENNGNV